MRPPYPSLSQQERLMAIRYVSEAVSAAIVDHDLAMDATSRAFIAATTGGCHAFPAVLGHGSNPANRFSIKAASTEELAGLKVGSYWGDNDKVGLPRHSSCILMFDQSVGRIGAVIEAALANAYRTAAANALAVRALARPDARRLAIFGAGHQAAFECAAVRRVRSIDEVRIVNRDKERAEALASQLSAEGTSASVSTPEEACGWADIIVTVTGARAPLFDAAWVRPGTHVSCMGADGRGKQEVPVDLLRSAQLFCDDREQSLAMGEFQHVASSVRCGELATPVPLGAVLAERHPGRVSPDSITVFDSSGLALQDLFLGACLLQEAEKRNLVEVL